MKHANASAIITHRLTFAWHVPSKKNGHVPLARGRIRIDPEMAADITALEWLARSAWGPQPPVEYPRDIRAYFYVRDGCADLDNKYTTIQDVLVKARVIRNDSIARVRKFSCEAYIDYEERVEVEIDE